MASVCLEPQFQPTPQPPLPPNAFPVLDAVFSSLTQILFDGASFHSRRRPATTPPCFRRRQSLWWNAVCFRALVARNSSWRDFRRLGSQEDHSRFRLLRQQFHSTVRSSRARFWSEWLDSVQSFSHRDPRLASSLIRRTFRTPTAPPNLCNMNWRGVRCSALSPHDAGTHWRAHFASSPTVNCVVSDDFFQSLSLRFAALTSSRESGRSDAFFLLQRACCCTVQVPRVFAGRGWPPILRFQSFLPLVASLAPLFLQPHLAVRRRPLRLDVQSGRSTP